MTSPYITFPSITSRRPSADNVPDLLAPNDRACEMEYDTLFSAQVVRMPDMASPERIRYVDMDLCPLAGTCCGEKGLNRGASSINFEFSISNMFYDVL